MWNPVDYFENANSKLKLTAGKYTFCRVTGLNNLEDVLANMTKSKAFFAVEDTNNGATVKPSAGYFNRRSVVVYILKKYNINDQEERETALNECRLIYKKLLTKLILDSGSNDDLLYLDKKNVPYREVPGYFSAGTCGLFFVLTLDEPINLVYDAADWNES